MLKYECDQCGETVGMGEAYGTDVVYWDPDGKQWLVGRPYRYTGFHGIDLTIDPDAVNGGQVCGMCVLDATRDLVMEMRPWTKEEWISKAEKGWIEKTDGPEEGSSSPDTDTDVPDVRANGEVSDTSTDDDSKEDSGGVEFQSKGEGPHKLLGGCEFGCTKIYRFEECNVHSDVPEEPIFEHPPGRYDFPISDSE